MLHSYDDVFEEIKSLFKNGKELSIYQILLMLTFTASIGVDTRPLEPTVNSILMERGYKDIEQWLYNVFKTLEKISSVQPYSSRSDISLCKSISESILYAKDADDLTHVPYSGTVGTVLSGLNSFLGGTPSHYKPSNYSRIFFFLVGGITWSEINDIRSVAKDVSDSEVLIGSTNIITHLLLLNDLYGDLPIKDKV